MDKDREVDTAINKSFKGVGLLVFLKLFLKFSQIFLNFLVIRAVDPTIYGSHGFTRLHIVFPIDEEASDLPV